MRATLRQVVAVTLFVAPVSGCALFEQRDTAGRRELERLPGLTGAKPGEKIGPGRRL